MEKYNIIRPKNHDEWLANREIGIGSSEVGTLLGLNPFETPYQLWLRKRGLIPPKEENLAMKLGHYMESTVAQLYADETGATIDQASEGDWLAVDKKKPFLRVSPDRLFTPQQSKAIGILECKTTQKTIDTDNIPMHWYAQLQYQLAVTRYEHGALAWLTQGREFGHREFDRNDDYCKYIIDRVDEFWHKNVIEGEEPQTLNNEDVLLKYPDAKEGKVAEASETVIEAISQLQVTKAEIAKLTDKKEELEVIIKAAIADAEYLQDNEGNTVATYRQSKPRKVFDRSKFEQSYPELYETFTTSSEGIRRLVIK